MTFWVMAHRNSPVLAVEGEDHGALPGDAADEPPAPRPAGTRALTQSTAPRSFHRVSRRRSTSRQVRSRRGYRATGPRPPPTYPCSAQARASTCLRSHEPGPPRSSRTTYAPARLASNSIRSQPRVSHRRTLRHRPSPFLATHPAVFSSPSSAATSSELGELTKSGRPPLTRPYVVLPVSATPPRRRTYRE